MEFIIFNLSDNSAFNVFASIPLNFSVYLLPAFLILDMIKKLKF